MSLPLLAPMPDWTPPCPETLYVLPFALSSRLVVNVRAPKSMASKALLTPAGVALPAVVLTRYASEFCKVKLKTPLTGITILVCGVRVMANAWICPSRSLPCCNRAAIVVSALNDASGVKRPQKISAAGGAAGALGASGGAGGAGGVAGGAGGGGVSGKVSSAGATSG